MKVGVPKEIKNHEYRVGLSPASAKELIEYGHDVSIAAGAAAGIGLTDDHYRAIGATIVDTNEEIFAKSEMVVKVKEPQPEECKQLREGQVLFTYLHLSPDPRQTKLLLESGVTAIAYETVTGIGGSLPLLAPMSEVAGRLAAQAGAHLSRTRSRRHWRINGWCTRNRTSQSIGVRWRCCWPKRSVHRSWHGC